MTHIRTISKAMPIKAYYYNISLMQKLSELVTLGSILESAKNILVGS